MKKIMMILMIAAFSTIVFGQTKKPKDSKVKAQTNSQNRISGFSMTSSGVRGIVFSKI
jgi:hypothetical protein